MDRPRRGRAPAPQMPTDECFGFRNLAGAVNVDGGVLRIHTGEGCLDRVDRPELSARENSPRSVSRPNWSNYINRQLKLGTPFVVVID